MKERLRTLRQEIEAVDQEILNRLNQRAEIARVIGALKKEDDVEVYDLHRERQVLDRVVERAGDLLPSQAVSAIFREVISACRCVEQELSVAFFGPAGSYTHLACIQHFGTSVNAQSQEGIQEVFEAIEREQADYGVVPIENSTEGTVDRTLDQFIESDVKICGEVLSRISHELLSKSGRSEAVRRIYSHPQAFGQCRQWLRKHFPHVEYVETGSTSQAAEKAASDEEVAAIASSFAGRLYGLHVIASHVEDVLQNYTRFLILGRKSNGRTGQDKTSLLISVPHVPGALHGMLKIISERGINLTKIESRPLKGMPWEYLFFVDFEGHAADPNVEDALTELSRQVRFMKILGSYPRVSIEEKETIKR